MTDFYNRDSVYWTVRLECFDIVQIFPSFKGFN